MKPKHLELLRCPKTGSKLQFKNTNIVGGRIRNGILIEPSSGNEYPIINFIPRFVSDENYASNFGLEWNIHGQTQYDEYSRFSVSRDRFQNETKWAKDLSGQTILEVGCGSGRFTTHAAETRATVVSFDFSNAVDANYKSNGKKDNVLILQASIFEMPFEENYFDKVYCFGVLQHTPNPKQAFLSLIKNLRPGGKIATDIYIKNIARWLLNPKYYVRPFTRGKNPEELYNFTCKYVSLMWPLARVIRKIPKVGYVINWRLLIADYSNSLPNADDATLKEWAFLDTFDMLSPMYDYPQTVTSFKRWHEEAGLSEIDVHIGYNGVEGRAMKPECSI
ncbi:MAG: methyltransferase domain-containing protein [Maribacter sp.]|nr:methyltransferase domain-containing protein [Maribacter sp.]